MNRVIRKPTCAVVIPVYKPTMSRSQRQSIKHLRHFLSGFDTYTFGPSTLSRHESGYAHIGFPAEHFKSVQTYSQLMLSARFYEKFRQYDYILVYQFDALIFSSDLLSWCRRGYDYIGAPWFKSIIGSLTCPATTPITGGNGGLSLRKVQSFLKVIEAVKQQAKRSTKIRFVPWIWFAQAIVQGKTKQAWLGAPAINYPFNEDGFWSFEAVKYDPSFQVAPQDVALAFSMEITPRRSFNLNGNKLPFGVHAWEKYDAEFWKDYLL